LANCPKCKTPLKDDFGLETCSGCGVVVFVNNDVVTLQEDEIQLDIETSEPQIVADIFEPIVDNETQEEASLPPNLEHLKNSNLKPEAELETKQEYDSLFTTQETDLDSEFENLNVSADPQDDDETDVDEKIEVTADIPLDDALLNPLDPSEIITSNESNLASMSADDFLTEMELFGEMDSEKFQDAIYFFDIEIASIDSKDVRDEILDLLEDSKLSLKVENLKQKIKNGVLLLPAVPAVKAYIVVQRLSHLPCEISWSLVEVHDLEAEDKAESQNLMGSETEDDLSAEPVDEFS